MDKFNEFVYVYMKNFKICQLYNSFDLMQRTLIFTWFSRKIKIYPIKFSI